MPSSEHWLTQCLGRIIPHEVHIPPYLQEILLRHPLLSEMPILRKMLAEVAAIQYLGKQQPPSLLIHRHNHLLLRQSQHLMQHIHHRPSKLPQSKIFQFSLQNLQLISSHPSKAVYTAQTIATLLRRHSSQPLVGESFAG